MVRGKDEKITGLAGRLLHKQYKGICGRGSINKMVKIRNEVIAI